MNIAKTNKVINLLCEVRVEMRCYPDYATRILMRAEVQLHKHLVRMLETQLENEKVVICHLEEGIKAYAGVSKGKEK